MTEVRSKVQSQVPGLEIETAQLMEDLIGDLTAVPQPIEVKLFGDDPRQLQDSAGKVVDAMKKSRSPRACASRATRSSSTSTARRHRSRGSTPISSPSRWKPRSAERWRPRC